MEKEMKLVEEPKKPLAMHPKKFAMWLFLASVMMLFASLTSAYIVREAEGNWVEFDLPDLFYYTTIIIVISSATMQIAYFAAKRNKIEKLKVYVLLTSILGVLFLVGQLIAGINLDGSGIHFAGNPSGSFLYVLAGLHGAHIISAVIYLFIVLNSAFKMRIHSGNMAQMEMCTTYWHFLGALWVYLFFFLMLYR